MQIRKWIPDGRSHYPSSSSTSSDDRHERSSRGWPWALLLSPALASADSWSLARDKNCFACHKLEGKRIGPAYADLARKYACDQQAKRKIIQQIEGGSVTQVQPVQALPQPIVATVSGFPTSVEWNKVTMPPQSEVSLDEAGELADWILSLAR